MTRHLYLVGIVMVAIALLHAKFPRYFGWKEGLDGLSLVNRQMLKIHCFFIALTVLLMGLLCLTSADELQTTVLGRRIALGLGVFWIARLVVQFFGYSTQLWRGKRFETFLHVGAALLWTYFSAVFLWIALAGN